MWTGPHRIPSLPSMAEVKCCILYLSCTHWSLSVLLSRSRVLDRNTAQLLC